ncbi:MAG TPA: hypothetical protein VIL34_05535 [Actinopolymorphaceae bacterium]
MLRRRRTPHTTVIELISNGTFVMDTVDTSTERSLARNALAALRANRSACPAVRVTVAGLGLGFTAHEILADRDVERIDVVEIEPAVVEWVRKGLVPETTGVLDDPRVHTHVADIRHWLPTRPAASTDVVLLDVDNGPDFLVHRANTEVYEQPFLTAVKRVLRPGGVIGVWSASRATRLQRRLEATFGTCQEFRQTVTREGREFDYFCYVARQSAPLEV